MNDRKPIIIVILIFGIFLSIFSLKLINPTIKINEFDGESAMYWVERQTDLGPRIPGSVAHGKVQELIVEELTNNKWSVEIQPCTIAKDLIAFNIVAKKGGGPDWIIIGAHYDSRVNSDQEIDSGLRQTPVPGANDGASGVSVLIELSRVLQEISPDQEIWLVFFDLEDNGYIEPYQEWILGSTCFVRQLPSFEGNRRPSAAIIVDMIGDEDLQIYYEVNSSENLRAEIWKQAQDLGYKQFVPVEKYAIIDDHTPFLAAGIPAVDIIDFDYPYWHTVQDTADKVSADSLEAVGRTLQVWLRNR